MFKKVFLALVAVLMIASAVVLTGCTPKTDSTASTESAQPASSQTPPAQPPAPPAKIAPVKDVTELKIEDMVTGTGAVAEPGTNVTVNYTGWLSTGNKFDSSIDRGQPFTFALGQGQVIAGWDQGVAGMKVGGKRKLIIPPDLGYGARGAGGGVIPPNATLVFEVDLLSVN